LQRPVAARRRVVHLDGPRLRQGTTDALDTNSTEMEVVVVRITRCIAALVLAAAPSIASGQNPTANPNSMAMPGARAALVRAAFVGQSFQRLMMVDAASMFLARTGDLQLTDAQVTRLAAIARRAETRQNAIHARVDSAIAVHHMNQMDGDGGPSATTFSRVVLPLLTLTNAELKAQHEDDREAFSVVNADQLATAFELMAGHHGACAVQDK
jgi:hypothetical protein